MWIDACVCGASISPYPFIFYMIAVEFIYAQSPAYMKGILLGLLFGTEGIATGFAAVFIALQDCAPQLGFCSFFGNTNFFWDNATSC